MFDLVPFRRNNDIRKRDFFDQMLDFFHDDFFTSIDFQSNTFKVDMKETADAYLIEADLPGVKKDAIDVDFNNNYLTIRVKRDDVIEDKKENYIRRERHYGELHRSFYIDNVKEEGINAEFHDGVLKITLPKSEKGKDQRKKIDIH